MKRLRRRPVRRRDPREPAESTLSALVKKLPADVAYDIFHKEHTRLLTNSLGSEQAADDLRKEAASLREKHQLCPHQDDERVYQTEQERAEDKRPPAICDLLDCGKKRLVVHVMLETDRPTLSLMETAQLVSIDLLR